MSLEEVTGLIAQIDLAPELPFAHFANHQAELATFAIETELVRRDEGFAPNDISHILPLQILRAIATTPAPVSLNYAIKSGDVGLVWLTLESGEEKFSVTSISMACRRGFTEVVSLIVNRGLYRQLPIDAINTLFIDACDVNNIEIVRRFLHEFNIKFKTINTSLVIACRSGYTDIVRLLFDRAKTSWELLYVASSSGHIETVRFLLSHGVDRHTRNSCAFNIIQYANKGEYYKIINLLLENN